MKQYDFTTQGINKFYDNVCDESTDKIHEIMEEVNNTTGTISAEQNARFETIYDSIAIKITIGNQTITIPNSADNVECIISAIRECREQTV